MLWFYWLYVSFKNYKVCWLRMTSFCSVEIKDERWSRQKGLRQKGSREKMKRQKCKKMKRIKASPLSFDFWRAKPKAKPLKSPRGEKGPWPFPFFCLDHFVFLSWPFSYFCHFVFLSVYHDAPHFDDIWNELIFISLFHSWFSWSSLLIWPDLASNVIRLVYCNE